jgi:hypothetical protein
MLHELCCTYSPRKVLDVSEGEPCIVVPLYQVIQGNPKGFEYQAVVVCKWSVFGMDGVDGSYRSGVWSIEEDGDDDAKAVIKTEGRRSCRITSAFDFTAMVEIE